MTCRQFPNLTFAPRKTCIECSNLTLHSYHATAILSINQGLWDCKYFFCEIVFFLYFFSYKAILGVYMVGNTKELSCISAITLDFPAICKAYFAHAPATRTSVHVESAPPMHRGCIADLLRKSTTITKKRGGLSAWQMLCKSQSSALSIAYDTGQFFLGMHIYP